MVAELKMVCTEPKILMQNKFKPVRPLDVVAAIRI